MFIAALFILAKRWKQHKYLPVNKRINQMWHTNIMWYYPAIKEWNTGTCHNMDEPWKYHVKWKKPVTKDNILDHSIPMKVHKGEIYRDRKLITDCLGLGGNRMEITRRQEVSFWGDKNVLKLWICFHYKKRWSTALPLMQKMCPDVTSHSSHGDRRK